MRQFLVPGLVLLGAALLAQEGGDRPIDRVTLGARTIFGPTGGRAAGFVSSDGDPWIDLDSLAEAVNGAAALGPGLRLSGDGVYALPTESCAACTVSVRQPGFVGRSRVIRGRRYVELTDVARAAGVRLDSKDSQRVVLVDRGLECDSCVLRIRTPHSNPSRRF